MVIHRVHGGAIEGVSMIYATSSGNVGGQVWRLLLCQKIDRTTIPAHTHHPYHHRTKSTVFNSTAVGLAELCVVFASSFCRPILALNFLTCVVNVKESTTVLNRSDQ